MRIGAVEAVVGIVVPCLDEEAAIGDVVRDLLAHGLDEVLVVDGGSTDRTAAVAEAAGARVVVERRRGYGRACAVGVAALRPDAAIMAFMDGDGSDDPARAPDIIGPVMRGDVDFCIASRLRGPREPGSMTPQQVVAGALAGGLMRAFYGARFTDMAPFRAIPRATLASLGMTEATYGWNLEMQMRVAARALWISEVPLGCRRRRGGTSKVSGNLAATLPAAWTLVSTFARLAVALKRSASAR